jgi:pimeloyl-ACP methyl ester carboxylesterase
LPIIAVSRQRVRAQAGWNVVEIPETGHNAMISAPQALIAALLAL